MSIPKDHGIAFLWNSRSLTGAQRRFFSIARAMSSRGLSVRILLKDSDARALRQLSGEPMPEILSYRFPWWVTNWQRGRKRWPKIWSMVGMEFLYYAAARQFWRKLLAREGIGICHVSMSWTLARMIPGAALFEVTSPDWVDWLESNPEMVPATMPLHAVSESVHERLQQKLPDRTSILAPLLFPNIDPCATPSPAMEKKENLVVFAHRLIPRKNGVMFARVVRRFLEKHPDWRVTIRGKGPDEAEIQAILDKEIAQGKVDVGYVPDLLPELRRARIFVSVIEPDNYPSQSVIEAMVCANALLLSDRGRTREKFFDENGRMTEIDEELMLSDLCDMVKDEKALDQMGRQSRSIVTARFSQDAYLEHLLTVYEQIHGGQFNINGSQAS